VPSKSLKGSLLIAGGGFEGVMIERMVGRRFFE
jgi:hypothetical protein